MGVVAHHPRFLPLLLLAIFTAIYFASTVGVSNSVDGPDYALTRAIVEGRTTQIGAYREYLNPDFAVVNNALYAKRPPGDSLLGVPFYVPALLFRGLALRPYNGDHPGINDASRTEALTMLFPAVCGAATVMLIYLIGVRLTSNKIASVLTAACAGLGSLLWRYSMTYQRGPVLTLMLTLLFYLFIRYRPADHSSKFLLLVGFVAGYLVVTDSASVLVGLLLIGAFGYAIMRYSPQIPNRHRLLLALGMGYVAGGSILVIYNLISFHQLFLNLYEHSPWSPWESYPVLFSTPLWPSVWVNLFNNGGVPLEAISPVVRAHPVWFAHEGGTWALQAHYRGLIIQSPYLFVGLQGFYFFWRRYRLYAVLALALSLMVLLIMSRYMTFFDANAFDTRYFLPIVPFVTLGLAFWLAFVLELQQRVLKIFLLLETVALCLVSVYNGWYATLEYYGPHVTGDHRFSLEIPPRDWLSPADGLHKVGLLFINTFPNICNLYMLAVYAICALFVYIVWVEIQARWRARTRITRHAGVGET